MFVCFGGGVMIGIYNLEGYPNLALEKVRAYYGNQAEDYQGELFNDRYDKVYVSSLFTWTPKPTPFDNWIVGGTGYNLTTKLPDEIEAVKPKVNFGFTTRGCINACKFCCVRQKEGKFHIVGDLLDLWDGNSKLITLLDNNPTADKAHFRLIAKQAKDNNIKINFHALDFRTFDDEICELLTTFKHTELRLAFDDISYKPRILKTIEMLKAHGIRQSTWYVLVGYNSTWAEDMERLLTLKEQGQAAFVQIYNKYEHPDRSKYTNLQRWANQHGFFKKMTYQEFLEVA